MSSSRFLLTLELSIPLPWTDQEYPPSVRQKVTRKLRVRMPFPDEESPKTREEWLAHIAAEIRDDIARPGSIEHMVGSLMDWATAQRDKIHVRWEQDCKDHYNGYVGEDVRVTCWPHPEGHWAWEVWGEDPDEPARIGRGDDYEDACQKAEAALAEFEKGGEGGP
jgi:hypothetical protein